MTAFVHDPTVAEVYKDKNTINNLLIPFSYLLGYRSATLCCVELDGAIPLELWWLRNITNWRNNS
jgi:hypothetical protein